MSDYPSQLEAANTTLQTKKNLPELFCRFFDAVQRLPSETHSPEAIANVQTVFRDVNSKVEEYNKQFKLLLQELGVLCKETNQTSKFQQFFKSFLDLLRLAYTVYEKEDEKLHQFEPLLEKILQLLQTNKIQLQQEDISTNALLLQVMNSAWALTNSRDTMAQTAKLAHSQRGGRTRKQRRH